MKTTPKIKLKQKQTDILLLLYKFRFLTRNQFQILLNHKYHSKVLTWLNELTSEKYIVRDYARTLAGKPAIYFLGTAGRKELLGRDNVKASLLKRVYQEKRTSLVFRTHCMIIADVYISLIELTKKHNAKLKFYTKVDLTDIKYLPLPHPDVYFSIEEKTITKRYFLEIFDEYPSSKWVFKRVQQFFHYYEERYWQDHNTNPFPEIIFVYNEPKTKKDLELFIKRRIDEHEAISFSLAPGTNIKQKGMSKEILYKIQ